MPPSTGDYSMHKITLKEWTPEGWRTPQPGSRVPKYIATMKSDETPGLEIHHVKITRDDGNVSAYISPGSRKRDDELNEVNTFLAWVVAKTEEEIEAKMYKLEHYKAIQASMKALNG